MQRNILHEIIKRKANWIGHILRRNCLLQQVIEGKIKGQIEVTRRRRRRRKKLLDDLKDRIGYCQLKEEALDRTTWRNRFGRGFGPVVWQIIDDDDDDVHESATTVGRTGRLQSTLWVDCCMHVSLNETALTICYIYIYIYIFIYLFIYLYCTGPCGSSVWVQVTHHHNNSSSFNKPTWSTYNVNTLFTSSWTRTHLLHSPYFNLEHVQCPNLCALVAAARPWPWPSELFSSKRFRLYDQSDG